MQAQNNLYWNASERAWQVVGYDIACDILSDHRFSSATTSYLLATTFPRERRAKIQPLIDYFNHWLFYQDPPAHTKLRRQLSPLFSQQAIFQYEEDIKHIVQETCAPLNGTFDFVSQVAQVIPARVIARWLGLPDEDAPLFLQWTLGLSEFVDCAIRMPDQYEPALAILEQQKHYFSERKRAQLLKEAHWSVLPMLIATGIETSMSFLSSGLYVLLTHEQAWQQLQQHSHLLDQALDELLRFEPPVHKTIRSALTSVSLADCQIEKDERVEIFLAAANRDPTIFSNPNVFDLHRSDAHPPLSFGYGIHYCLGRVLGRLTVKTCFNYLLNHWPDVALKNKEVSWHTTPSLRRLESLWVVN